MFWYSVAKILKGQFTQITEKHAETIFKSNISFKAYEATNTRICYFAQKLISISPLEYYMATGFQSH